MQSNSVPSLLSMNLGVFNTTSICEHCGEAVKQMKQHLKRHHQVKFWGFKCPECSCCFSQVDKSAYLNHLTKIHNIEIKNTNNLLVQISEGYLNTISCSIPNCWFKSFSIVKMDQHLQRHKCEDMTEYFRTVNNLTWKINQLTMNNNSDISQYFGEMNI